MPLLLVRNDITKMDVDAIVNAAKNSLLGGGGVDGAIHDAAGPELLAECRTLGGCETGEAKATAAYRLPCRHVIHTVGPVWQGGKAGERELLRSCYRNSLELAETLGCATVAFPLISAGVFGYPKEQAVSVAMNAISEFLLAREADMTVYLVLFGHDSAQLGRRLYPGLEELIDDGYALRSEQRFSRSRLGNLPPRVPGKKMEFNAVCADYDLFEATESAPLPSIPLTPDESFSQMVLRKIDEKGIKDSECYKKANLTKQLFSKIRSDVNYQPSKPTAVALAMALELPRREFEDLLKKAGFALSDSKKFDLIIRYFLDHHVYDVMQINEALFSYDQSLLGS